MEAQAGVEALGPSPHTALKASRAEALQAAAAAWCAEVLGVARPRELADPLLLGRVAEVLQALLRGQRGEIAARCVPPLQPSARGRITGYTRWQQVCRELGVGAGQVPALSDVEEGRGGPAVCACVWAVAERAAALGLPVPHFGGTDWHAAMPREVAVKRAELFEGSGQSPPKLPALDKLLTPRAYACKPDSPAGGGTVPALRDSNASLRDWLHGSSQKGGTPAGAEGEGQEQHAVSRGLGSTVAALEAAAAEAAEAARQLKLHQDKAQALRRPSLPPLDVAAAAAAAAAEAAELDSGAREAYAPSPLSSPGSSYGSPGGAGYCSSSTYLSGSSSPALSSPARYRLTPTRLKQSGVANPLFDQPVASPQPAAASQAGGAPAVMQPGQEAAEAAEAATAAPACEGGTCGSSRSSATAGVQPLSGLLQRSPVRHLEREESEEEAGEEAAYLRGSLGGGGDLLESLLSPPHLKPVHTQLLGALMHTRTAGHAAKPAQQAQMQQWVQQRGEESEEEETAVPAVLASAGAAAEPAEAAQQQQPDQAEEAAEAVAEPQLVADAPAAAAARRCGGLRRFSLLLLGAAAGAAAAVLAQQQGGSGRRRANGQPKHKEHGGQQEKKGSSRSGEEHLALTRG